MNILRIEILKQSSYFYKQSSHLQSKSPYSKLTFAHFATTQYKWDSIDASLTNA